MEYICLANTDLYVSSICLGTAKFGTIVEQESSFELLNKFRALGGNFIDTANCYSDWFGGERSASEKTIGRWLKNNTRNQIIISTKGGYPDICNKSVSRLSRKDLEADIMDSLNNLGTDYIDIYWLHRDDTSIPVSHFIHILNEFKQKGLIRYFACSNWSLERIIEAQEYSSVNHLNSFIASQVMWNIGKINEDILNDSQLVIMDKKLIKYHQKNDFTAIPYSTQANGFFSGKYNYLIDASSSNIESEEIYYGTSAYKLYNNKHNLRVMAEVIKLSKELGISQTQVILTYLLHNQFTTVPIIGCRTVQHLKDSCFISDLTKRDNIIRVIQERFKAIGDNRHG